MSQLNFNQQQNRIIGISELAGILSVSHTTAWRLVKNGHIQGIKIGGEWKTTYAACTDYLRRKRISQKSN